MTRYIRGSSHFVTSMTAPIASGWSNFAGWVSHPLENAAFARRTPFPDIQEYFACSAKRYSNINNVSSMEW